MGWLEVAAGVVGLVVAGFALFDLAHDARRHRRPAPLVAGLAVAAAVISLLVLFSDRILQ